MDFRSPLSLTQWLIAGAVPAGVVVLYFLKLRRHPEVVASTYLWKRTVEDLHVNSLLQRLRRNILLLLQLALLALALLALAGPRTWIGYTEGQRFILLVDNSASMGATDVAPTRLASAKESAARIINAMSRGDRAMIIAFNREARTVVSYTRSRHLLLDRLGAIPQTQTRTDVLDALHQAVALATKQAQTAVEGLPPPRTAPKVYLFTDGGFEPPSDETLDISLVDLHYVPIGTAASNVAVTAMRARRHPDRPEQLQVFGRIDNFGPARAATIVSLVLDGDEIDAQRVTIAPGEQRAVLFDLAGVEGGVLELRVQGPDSLAADDRAWAVLEPARQARVLVISQGNLFLERALRADLVAPPEWRKPAVLGSPEYADAAQSGRYDLIVFDRCTPATPPAANTVILGAVPRWRGVGPARRVETPVIEDWNSMHPLMRFLYLDNVPIAEATVVPLPAGATSLIEGRFGSGPQDHGPLAFVLPHEGFRHCVVLFDPFKSYWPLRASFPMFVRNCMLELGNVSDPQRGRPRAPGDRITIRTELDLDTIAMVGPDQTRTTVRARRPHVFVFSGTDRPGVYQAVWQDTVQRHFAVNLFDPIESDLKPRRELRVNFQQLAARPEPRDTNQYIWQWFALAALVVCLAEWYIYNRRVYI